MKPKKINWIKELRTAMDKQKFDKWFIKPNKAFEGKSPLDLVVEGKIKLIENAAYDILTGQFS